MDEMEVTEAESNMNYLVPSNDGVRRQLLRMRESLMKNKRKRPESNLKKSSFVKVLNFIKQFNQVLTVFSKKGYENEALGKSVYINVIQEPNK